MKKISLCCIIFALPLLSQACHSKQQVEQTAPATTQTAVQSTAQTLIEQNISPKTDTSQGIWIDVRSAEEYQAGHLVGAVNIPYTEMAEKISSITTDKNAEIHLYCRSGRRSEVALQTLKQMGYTKIVNHGAYDDLK